MDLTKQNDFIVGKDDLVLITGATGFIGSRLVANLVDRGFRNLRCLARPSGKAGRMEAISAYAGGAARVELVTGNLLSREDCSAVTEGAAVIYHLAAGRGEKSVADAFLNSVVTTRNLIEASLQHQSLERFVNVSSFAVYTNGNKPKGRLLDETCPVEENPAGRGDAYCFAKAKQDEIVVEYGRKFGLPYVILRPGYVYGPGNEGITGRVGINPFGIFLHLGGSNTIPLSFVENCVEAIALAGLKCGVEGEIFNVVDDDLPSSRRFLREYKKNVKGFKSIYLPHAASYGLCYLWERYSSWSNGQLPPVFNRRDWQATWKKTRYSNEKVKASLGWTQIVPTAEGMRRHFEACRERGRLA
jgi:nucleoside-diphosphate-sugar epimerase